MSVLKTDCCQHCKNALHGPGLFGHSGILCDGRHHRFDYYKVKVVLLTKKNRILRCFFSGQKVSNGSRPCGQHQEECLQWRNNLDSTAIGQSRYMPSRCLSKLRLSAAEPRDQRWHVWNLMFSCPRNEKQLNQLPTQCRSKMPYRPICHDVLCGVDQSQLCRWQWHHPSSGYVESTAIYPSVRPLLTRTLNACDNIAIVTTT